MMDEERSSAIIVTFHPQAEHLESLRKVRAQVDLLVVVDNGSPETELGWLRQASRNLGFALIENGKNLGIATALNLGIREAQRAGCHWVFLFDQDSNVTEGFVAAMVADFRACRLNKPILQMIPRYRDPETGTERSVSRFRDGGVFLTITSGSLFSMEAFEKCGLFQEELFIYCVDDDYSLRIRKRGFYIGNSEHAVLLHQSGHPTTKKLFGMRMTTKNYRPEVRYYYARNKVWILQAYGLTFPRLIIPTLREFVTIPIKIALMERDPREKIKFFVKGLTDGLLGRMGPLRLS